MTIKKIIKDIENYLSQEIKKGTWEHNKTYSYLVDVHYELKQLEREQK